MTSNSLTEKSYLTPLVARVYSALPWHPVWTGMGFASVLLLAFLISDELRPDDLHAYPGDYRLTIIHILLTAFSATAYVYLLNATKNAARELIPVVQHDPQWQIVVDRSGTHLWWGLDRKSVV